MQQLVYPSLLPAKKNKFAWYSRSNIKLTLTKSLFLIWCERLPIYGNLK